MRDAFALAKRTVASLNADHATSYAAAIAYFMLFSLFPLALTFISVSGFFLTNQQRDNLVTKLSNELTLVSTAEIYRQVQNATNGRVALGFLGIVGTLWSATSVFTAMRVGLNAVWHTNSRHQWVIAKALDLLSVMALGGVLLAALLATVAITRLTAVARQLLGSHLSGIATITFGLILALVPVVIAFIGFFTLYVLASPPWIRLRHAAVGAVMAAFGFEVVSLGFSYYVRYFGTFDRVYGSLGAAIAFLFYAYLTGLVILIGGELTEQYMELRERSDGAESAPRKQGTPVL